MTITTTLRHGILAALTWALVWTAACPANEADAVQEWIIRAVRDVGGVAVRDRQLPEHPIVTVRFGHKPVDATLMAQIGTLGDLRELDFESLQPITDADLRLLAGLRRLRKLTMWRAKITDAGLATLAGLPELEELGFVSRYVTDAGLKSLANLHNLRVLRASCRSDGSGLASLKDVPNLQVLDLSGGETSAALFRAIKVLPALKELGLGCNGEVSDTDMKLIAELPHLEKLVLFSEAVTDDGLRALAGSPSLKSLYIRSSRITGTEIGFLRAFPNLEELLLHVESVDCLEQAASLAGLRSTGSDRATNATLHKLTALPHLRKLDLGYASVTDAGLKDLHEMGDLEELDLSWNEVTNAGIAELSGLKKLRILKLEATKVGDAALPAIAKLTSLRELKLSGHATDAGLDMLARLPVLEALDLSCSEISDAGVAKFEHFPSLSSLEIGSANLTDAGLRNLARVKNLRLLELCSVSGRSPTFTDAGFRQLQEALPYTEVRRR